MVVVETHVTNVSQYNISIEMEKIAIYDDLGFNCNKKILEGNQL